MVTKFVVAISLAIIGVIISFVSSVTFLISPDFTTSWDEFSEAPISDSIIINNFGWRQAENTQIVIVSNIPVKINTELCPESNSNSYDFSHQSKIIFSTLSINNPCEIKFEGGNSWEVKYIQIFSIGTHPSLLWPNLDNSIEKIMSPIMMQIALYYTLFASMYFLYYSISHKKSISNEREPIFGKPKKGIPVLLVPALLLILIIFLDASSATDQKIEQAKKIGLESHVLDVAIKEIQNSVNSNHVTMVAIIGTLMATSVAYWQRFKQALP